VSQTYSNVDSSGDPAGAVEWQENMAAWPTVAVYKRRTYELLMNARRVLDIGSGPGIDLAGLGPARSFGIDRSSAMCAAAATRGSRVLRADAHALPLVEAAFDGVRVDRLFQHVADPEAALREANRVLAPGGRLVIAEPDQESLVIHVPGVRQRVLDRLKTLRRDVGYRNGRLASRLPAMCHDHGLRDMAVEAFPITIRDPDHAFGLRGWPALWRLQGPFTDEELVEWHRALDSAARGFLYVVTVLVVTGVKPQRQSTGYEGAPAPVGASPTPARLR
jgi:SAM-dependent methyltransferase